MWMQVLARATFIDTTNSPSINPAIPLAMVLLFVVLGLGVLAIVFLIWGMIFKRAGYSMAMALLMFIPLVNLIWLLIFAFSEWPIQRELQALRSGRMPPGAYPPQAYPQQGYPGR